MLRVVLFIFVFIVVTTCSNQTFAVSGQRYASGAEDFLCGVAPDPGLYLLNYAYWYSSSSLRDDKGKDIKDLKFNINVWVDAPRLLYFFPGKVLGAIYGVYFTLPVYYADIKVKDHGISIVDDHSSGVGDILFSPLILGWHFGRAVHTIFSFDINAPTGHYDGKNLANSLLAKNYWTFQPNLAVTLIAGPGIDISAKVIYEFHTDNDEYLAPPFFTESTYSPGSGLNVDFALGVPLSPDWRVGMTGFFYTQLRKDKIEKLAVKYGKAKDFALGPAIKYSGSKLALIFKEQFEILSRNRPKGNVTWLEIQYQF